MYTAGELRKKLERVPDDVIVLIMHEEATDAYSKASFAEFFEDEDEEFGSSFAIYPNESLVKE